MDAYRVLSPREQREGGQGVVQFMRWARTEEPVAVKFFLSQATFDKEMQLYVEDSLRSMMPVMREAVRAGQVKNRSGYMFPAFVVLERGESLQDWRRNVMPQTATVVDVCALLAHTSLPRGSCLPATIKSILNACYCVKLFRALGRHCHLLTFLCRPELHFSLFVLLVVHKSAFDVFSRQDKRHTLRPIDSQGQNTHPHACRL